MVTSSSALSSGKCGRASSDPKSCQPVPAASRALPCLQDQLVQVQKTPSEMCVKGKEQEEKLCWLERKEGSSVSHLIEDQYRLLE